MLNCIGAKKAHSSFLKNSQGGTAVTFGVALLGITIAVGVAIDLSRQKTSEVDLQSAVDAAALAGAAYAGDDSEKVIISQRAFSANASNPCTNDPAIKIENNSVEVLGSCEVQTKFMGIAGINTMPVSAVAVAGYEGGPAPVEASCIHALNPSKNRALIYNNKRGPLKYTGNSIIAPDCDVQVNSSNRNSVYIKEDEGYQFKQHCFVGSVEGSLSTVTPPPDTSCKAALPDPLAARPLPAKPACGSGGMSNVGGALQLRPGGFCSGMNANGGNIILAPGVYHVSGGDFKLRATASITGSDVTIVMHPGSGKIDMESEGEIKLTASTSGEMAGFLIYDRNGRAKDHLIKTDENDAGIFELDGVIYAPEDHMELFWKRGGVNANEKPFYFKEFGIIADTIDLHGYNQVYIEPVSNPALIPEIALNGNGGTNISSNVRLLK